MTLAVSILDPLPQHLRTEAPIQPVSIGLAMAETAPRILDGGDKRRLDLLVGLDANPDQPLGYCSARYLSDFALVPFGIDIVDGQLLGVDRPLEELDKSAKLIRREDWSLLLVVHPQHERGNDLHFSGQCCRHQRKTRSASKIGIS